MAFYLTQADEGTTIYPDTNYTYMSFCLYGAGGAGSVATDDNQTPAGAGGGASIWVQFKTSQIQSIYVNSIPYESGRIAKITITTVEGNQLYYQAGSGQNSKGSNPGLGGVASYTQVVGSSSSNPVAIYAYDGPAGGNYNCGGSARGYTASGSGINAFTGNDMAQLPVVNNQTFHGIYTITSTGAGINQTALFGGVGGGGGGVPNDYKENPENYAAGAPGTIMCYYA